GSDVCSSDLIIPTGFEDVQIQPNGAIIVQRGGQTEQVGNIAVVEAAHLGTLEATGQNAFRIPEDADGNIGEMIRDIPGQATVLQSGALEKASDDISKQMADLVSAQRSYQSNARTISMGDQMLGLINQLR